MRKTFSLFIVLAFLFSFSGCSAPSPEAAAEEIGKEFGEASSVRMTVNVTADYGENAYIFKLRCRLAADDGDIEIVEPASVAGVHAVIGGDGITLSYDGAEVFTGAVLPDGLSPVDAIPVMADAWRRSFIDEAVREKYGETDCIAVRYLITDGVTLRTWFDGETHLPVAAEFSNGEYTVINCTFDNVMLE